MFSVKLIFWTSIFLVLYAYLIYPFLLIVIDKTRKRVDVRMTNILPKVSLIIAAYNEEKVIEDRIVNCLSLDYPPELLEVIVASDGSTDRTAEIAGRYVSKGIILLDYKLRRGKVNVLNETIRKAKHSIIVLSDANTGFKRDALKNLVRHFGDDTVGVVCGALYFINADGSKSGELEGIYWKYETFLKRMEGHRGCLLGANGAIYAIRKELYEECPPDTIVEDFVIPMKILQRGYKVIYDPEANAVEESAYKIVQEKERRIRIGAGDFQALFRLLPMLNPAHGFSALAFWSHKVLRWFAPFFLFLAFVTNLSLVGHPYYAAWLLLQTTFYLFALAGQILSKTGVNNKLLSCCYYFVSMNLALFLGFIRYIRGRQNVAWDRTER